MRKENALKELKKIKWWYFIILTIAYLTISDVADVFSSESNQ